MAGRPGPKAQADPSPLPLVSSATTETGRFEDFCAQFLITPKGAGAKGPFTLRPFQRDLLVPTVLDGPAKLIVWSLARGAGKSSLTAALGLFHVLCAGVEGARCVVVAQDERSSRRLLGSAARMVALNEELSARCQVYVDRIVVPATDSVLVALPGEAARIEGEDASLAVADEIGFVRQDAFESLLHSTGKRAGSRLLCIGTPSPPAWREISPMLTLVLDARSRPDDPDVALVEFAGDVNHAVDCACCWEAANPGLDDLVSREHLRAALPPRSRESEFRRARLGQWVQHDDSAFIPPAVWNGLSTGEGIPDGADVVLGVDGSYNGDGTAIVAATVSKAPHADLVRLWEPPKGQEEYRIPVLEVEDEIRAACERWNVLEVAFDPFRFGRTMQILASENVPVIEFHNNARRLTPATADLVAAANNGDLTHSGNVDLTRHVLAATVQEDRNGVHLAKERRNSTRRIDCAAALLMAHARATWRATRKPTRRRVASFRR